jgi:hypothetical protein
MRHALNALERLSAAMRDAESALAAMKAEHDPLASHIFISRRHYRNANDTKGGKRREMNARLSFNTACELGFRGNLDEWERLMGAVTEASRLATERIGDPIGNAATGHRWTAEFVRILDRLGVRKGFVQIASDARERKAA